MTAVLPSPHLRADHPHSPVPSFRDLFVTPSNSRPQSPTWTPSSDRGGTMQNNGFLSRPALNQKNSSSRINTPSPHSSTSNLSASNPSLSPARLPFPTRTNPTTLSHSVNSASSTSLSRLSSSLSRSRRPSAALATLQSFLEGVEFATRCTGANGDKRRGESRASSRQTTDVGLERGRASVSSLSLSPPPPKAKRTFSQELQAFASDDEDEEMLDSSFADRTVRPADEEQDDEDNDVEADGIAVFTEGQRLEVGALHAGCTVSALELPAKNATASPVKRLEIVRKLGSGSYAVVYLCRAIVYDPYDDEEDWDDDAEVVYGQEFALKCLCKKNLSSDLLSVQKFEAILHHSLPAHQNIVALHGAFETDDWLFLILEYCPGQDLFYWLEQARDHEDVEELMHPTASFQHAGKLRSAPRMVSWQPESHSATPPSPSLLSMTAMNQLLSRRRLRLISRMFMQMCDAVDACHKMGISHRDIKPENFICCEEDSKRGLERRVMVKITDWGLGTSDSECTDFDCGSKPYMAYECRNNLGPTYRPKEADIWSLGIVLINLLFHRCPWSDPSLSDPDFSEYCRDPVRFLNDRFEGIGPEVSTYLAAKVLNCEGPRATAGELSLWASRLVQLMSEVKEPTVVSEAAVPLKATRPTERRLSQILSESSSTRPSPRSSLLAQYMISVPASPSSPTSPSPRSNENELPQDLKANLAMQDLTLSDLATTVQVEPANSRETTSNTPASSINGPNFVASPISEAQPVLPLVTALEDSDAAVLAAKAKRRKRGARRGRPHVSSTKPEDPSVSAIGKAVSPIRDKQLDELADASQRLARELSRNPNVKRPDVSKQKSTSNLVGKFKGSLSGGHAGLEALAQQRQRRETQWNGGTYSAPADLQHTTSASSNGSASSFGTNSWSVGESNNHWNSTSTRRHRQTLSRFNPDAQLSGSSHSQSTSSSPSRFSHSTDSNLSSPISSIASTSPSFIKSSTATTNAAPTSAETIHSESVSHTAPSIASVDSAETIASTPKQGKISRIFSRFGRT